MGRKQRFDVVPKDGGVILALNAKDTPAEKTAWIKCNLRVRVGTILTCAFRLQQRPPARRSGGRRRAPRDLRRAHGPGEAGRLVGPFDVPGPQQVCKGVTVEGGRVTKLSLDRDALDAGLAGE